MGEDDFIAFRLHLNSGESVPVYVAPEEGDDTDPDELAQAMAEEFNSNRPGWYRLGSTLFFSGAVCAIEIDAHLGKEEVK